MQVYGLIGFGRILILENGVTYVLQQSEPDV